MKWIKDHAALTISVAVLVVLALTVWWWIVRSPKPRQVAVVLPMADNPFWREVRRGAEEAQIDLGPKYHVAIDDTSALNAGTQIEVMDRFLSQNVSALVLGPASDTETVPMVAKYSALKIPIVVIDTELSKTLLAQNKVSVGAFLGSDNVDGGRKAATVIAEALGVGTHTVLLIHGNPVHQSALDRAAGFEEVAKKDNFGIDDLNADWSRERAEEMVSSRLARGRVEAIFACNDDMALGAVAALRNHAISPGSTQWPIIVGFDATRDGLAAVASGEMYASVKQDAHKLGYEGVMRAVRLINGDKNVPAREFFSVEIRKR
jgi:ribose transport system substrate-binding protein